MCQSTPNCFSVQSPRGLLNDYNDLMLRKLHFGYLDRIYINNQGADNGICGRFI
jgi:hypothetical protein